MNSWPQGYEDFLRKWRRWFVISYVLTKRKSTDFDRIQGVFSWHRIKIQILCSIWLPLQTKDATIMRWLSMWQLGNCRFELLIELKEVIIHPIRFPYKYIFCLLMYFLDFYLISSDYFWILNLFYWCFLNVASS